MKPVMQSICGSGENGEPTGTCFRASIASVIGCQESDLRPYEREDIYPPDTNLWVEHMCEDLERLGFKYIGWLPSEHVKEYAGVDGYCVAFGKSPRGYARGHACVYYMGELAHDPHPSGDGLTELEGCYCIERANK